MGIRKKTSKNKRFLPFNYMMKFGARYVWILWALLILGLVIGITCGIVGYLRTDALINPVTGKVEIADAVYATLELLRFSGHGNHPAPNELITFARFLLPAILSIAALLALFTVIRKCFHRVRTYSFKNHTIVCGLGKRGASYISDAVKSYQNRRRANLNIIAIEKNPDNPAVRFCQDNGITVLIGDATDENVLSLARPYSAKELFSFLPDDGVNIALANTLAGIFKRKYGTNYTCKKGDGNDNEYFKCHLSIYDLHLLDQFGDRKFTFRDDKNNLIELPLEIDFWYSKETLSERAIMKGVRNLILNGIEDGNVFNSMETPEFVILGAGYTSRIIIATISSIFHLSNEVHIEGNNVSYSTPVILTVFDTEKDAIQELYKDFPILQSNPEEIIPYSREEEELNINKNIIGNTSIKLPLPKIQYNIFGNSHEKLGTFDFENAKDIVELAEYIYNNKNIGNVIIALDKDSTSVSTAMKLERLFNSYIKRGLQGHIPKIYLYYEKNGGFDTLFGYGTNNNLSISYIKNIDTPGEMENDDKILPLCRWSQISYDKYYVNDMIDNVAVGENACANIRNGQGYYGKERGKYLGTLDTIDDNEFAYANKEYLSQPLLQIIRKRNQVYHNKIKLKLLGYSILKKGRPIPQNYELLSDWSEIYDAVIRNKELLTRMEHMRWWAESLVLGGHYNHTNDTILQFHNDLVPFEYIHDVSKDNIGKFISFENYSETQMEEYYAIADMILAFKNAGYLPVKYKKKVMG